MTAAGQNHYYWLTSLLAARGLQTRTCRVIAATNAGFGVGPLLLMLSPAGPHGEVPRAIAVAIAVIAMSAAAVWLRHSWPSQRVSAILVSVGAIPTSAGCLIMTDPMLGLLTTTAFIFASCYVGFLHRPSVLAVPWTLGVLTLGYLAVQIGSHDPVLAACAVIFVVLLNAFVFFSCRLSVGLNSTDIHHSEIEPLTGLLNTDGLYSRAANLLAARNRQDDRHMVLAVVSIDSFPLLSSISGPRRAGPR